MRTKQRTGGAATGCPVASAAVWRVSGMMEGPARSCSCSVCWPSFASVDALHHHHSHSVYAASRQCGTVIEARFIGEPSVNLTRETQPGPGGRSDHRSRPAGGLHINNICLCLLDSADAELAVRHDMLITSVQ